MKVIRDYIDSLFMGIEETEQIVKVKDDLLASSEDKFEDLKNQGKSDNEAIGSIISGFGSIDELLEEMGIEVESSEPLVTEDAITLDEVAKYLTIYKKASTEIGLGVMFILLGLAFMFFSMEYLSEAVGLVGLFIGIASGVGLFILSGVKITNINKKLNDRLITKGIKEFTIKKKEAFQKSYVFCLVAGVGLCIISVTPLIFLSESQQYTTHFQENIGVALMMLLCSIGIFFLIFGGVTMLSFNKFKTKYFIADTDKLGPNAKEERRKNKFFAIFEKLYWPVVVFIYLIESFSKMNWGSSWMIFIGATLLFYFLESFFVDTEE